VPLYVPLGRPRIPHHCWHDVNVKFPGGPVKTVDSPTQDGRVCCYCGEIRKEPLPSQRPKRAHGPYVDDDSEWYVVDSAECPGLGFIELNPEPKVVDRDEPANRGQTARLSAVRFRTPKPHRSPARRQ
jgi:hypothetical protein